MNIQDLKKQFESSLTPFSKSNNHPVSGLDHVVRDELQYDHLMVRGSGTLSSEPKTIGIVFSGGPAPGGHDVLCGILSHLRDEDQLIGFCGGPGGLLRGITKMLSSSDISEIQATGGFDMLGTDRTKISTEAQFDQVREQVKMHRLDALIIVGGDDSNTNALYLADALFGECLVIGVPKTIDGDLRYLPFLPITFGFHSATQHYASLVHQLMIDAQATRKYWHVVKLMGRAASHVTLEVALQVQPHVCLLSEEVAANGWSLRDVIEYFSSVIINRAHSGHPYGVMLFPEGIVDVVPELKAYVSGDLHPINDILGYYGLERQRQISVQNDAHGNANLSMIRVEDLLLDLIQADVAQQLDNESDIKLMNHFFGYTGRGVPPTEFDSVYSQLLGKTAYELVLSQITGVIASVGADKNKNIIAGLPLNSMVSFDKERDRYVIKKQLVDVMSPEYAQYIDQKEAWQSFSSYFPRKVWTDVPIIVTMNTLNKEALNASS